MHFAALQHSVFLQALGSAILNSIWQCFVLWLIYQIILISYKNASAKFKTNLGTAILFFSFAWFVINFICKFASPIPASEITSTSFVTGVINTPEFWNYDALFTFATAALPYLSIAYIFLLFFLMARLIAAYRYVSFISSKQLSAPPAEMKAFALLVSRQIGISRQISVWISHRVDIPATIGFFKPIILIPVASINNLSGLQLEAIILHELSHIKRNDYVINLVISIIETILFFNPFILLLSNVIKKERENCCDDFVLQYQYDPHAYASALLSLEKSRLSSLKLAIGAVSGKKELLSRIKRITTQQVISREFNYGQKLFGLLLITGIICSLAWLSPSREKTVSIVLSKESKPNSIFLSRQKEEENIMPENPSGNIKTDILKHVAPKHRERVTITETVNDLQDLPQQVEAKIINRRKKIGSDDFFLNGDSLQFLPLPDNHKFPLQISDDNLNTVPFNFAKLNNKLVESLVKMKDINWKKFESNINGQLPKLNIENLPSKEELDFYITKAADASKIFNQKQTAHVKAMLAEVQNELASEDCFIAEQDALSKKNNLKRKTDFIRLKKEKKNTENMDNNFSIEYALETPSVLQTKMLKQSAEKKISLSIQPRISKKLIRISIKQLPAMATLLNDQKAFHYYFNDSKNSARSNGVDIELSEMQ